MAETLACPYCYQDIPLSHFTSHLGRKGGPIGGKSCSEAKKKASRENGKLGGRPKKKP